MGGLIVESLWKKSCDRVMEGEVAGWSNRSGGGIRDVDIECSSTSYIGTLASLTCRAHRMTHVEIIERYGFQIALNFFDGLQVLCEGS